MPSLLKDKLQPDSKTRACHGYLLVCGPLHQTDALQACNRPQEFQKKLSKYLGHCGITEVESLMNDRLPAVFRKLLDLQIQLRKYVKHSCVCPDRLSNESTLSAFSPCSYSSRTSFSEGYFTPHLEQSFLHFLANCSLDIAQPSPHEAAACFRTAFHSGLDARREPLPDYQSLLKQASPHSLSYASSFQCCMLKWCLQFTTAKSISFSC